MPVMATMLVIPGLILMQLVSTNGRVAGCTSEVMKTPAVYLGHIGDEDKPIRTIVIAASRPTEQELGRAMTRGSGGRRESCWLGWKKSRK